VYYQAEGYHALTAPARPRGKASTWLAALRRLHLRLSRPAPRPVPGARHLDFGCGTGDYLAFTTALGWDATGAEYNDEAARSARVRGFRVVLEGDLPALPDGSLGFVSMIHSLEHVPDPPGMLAALSRKLAPGGVLLVEVPYLECHEFAAFGKHYAMIQAPLHLQFFSDRTMEVLAQSASLRLLRRRNNIWTPVAYVWSLLNAMEVWVGFRMSRRSKNIWSAAAFPLLLPAVAITSMLGAKGVARQYFFTKRPPGQ
jgi:SAM-dependent methyltransferase